MALETNELFSSAAGKGSEVRMVVDRNKVGTLAVQSGAPLLPKLSPLSYDSSLAQWTVYTQPSDSAVYTITDQSGGTDGGTFQVMIDGLASVHAWNATPAAMQTELLALLADAGKAYTVAVTNSEANIGVAAAVATLTFSEDAGAPSVDIDTSGLTDGGVAEPANLVLAATDAGTQLNGTDQIRGFVQDADGVQSDASDEVQVTIALEGEMHRDDINTAAIRAVLGGSPSEAELDTALQSQAVRGLGLHIRGLADVS